eukprot:64413-Pyramimonas_sp.AAC.1
MMMIQLWVWPRRGSAGRARVCSCSSGYLGGVPRGEEVSEELEPPQLQHVEAVELGGGEPHEGARRRQLHRLRLVVQQLQQH